MFNDANGTPAGNGRAILASVSSSRAVNARNVRSRRRPAKRARTLFRLVFSRASLGFGERAARRESAKKRASTSGFRGKRSSKWGKGGGGRPTRSSTATHTHTHTDGVRRAYFWSSEELLLSVRNAIDLFCLTRDYVSSRVLLKLLCVRVCVYSQLSTRDSYNIHE